MSEWQILAPPGAAARLRRRQVGWLVNGSGRRVGAVVPVGWVDEWAATLAELGDATELVRCLALLAAGVPDEAVACLPVDGHTRRLVREVLGQPGARG